MLTARQCVGSARTMEGAAHTPKAGARCGGQGQCAGVVGVVARLSLLSAVRAMVVRRRPSLVVFSLWVSLLRRG